MWQLRERVAVVTGAASGIGLAITKAFVREGMRVVMADVNERDLQLRSDELARQGGDVYAREVDVRDPEAVDGVGAAAVDRFGALHVAVNNAGVVSTGYSWELPLDEWHRVIDIDLWGVIHGIRAFVPRILASGEEGHVVNVASMAAVRAPGRLGPYTAAKHGSGGQRDRCHAEQSPLRIYRSAQPGRGRGTTRRYSRGAHRGLLVEGVGPRRQFTT